MEYSGDKQIFKREKAVILNSRQSKTPTGADPWIANSYKAVADAVSNGCTIITSIGMNTWEFTLWAAGKNNGNQIIVIPIDSRDDPEKIKSDLMTDFELNPEKTGFMFFPTVKKGARGKNAWQERDKIAVSLANVIYPISIRKGGNLENLFQENPAKMSNACLDYHIEYSTSSPREKVSLTSDDLSKKIMKIEWDHLTHFTRTSYTPWPGESSASFYESIYKAREGYPRLAINTLKKIVTDKKIWGSYLHIRGGHKVVSFTDLNPEKSISLIRWRPRYVRWNFEPYSIVIEKEFASSLGIRPVIYGIPKIYDTLDFSDQPFYQNPGEKRRRLEA